MSKDSTKPFLPRPPLWRPEHEHDACGVGFVADLGGQPTHGILRLTVQAVVNVTHRGAVSADGKSGDGAGVLTQLPLKLLRRELLRHGVTTTRFEAGDLALGMLFLPRTEPRLTERAVEIVNKALAREHLEPLWWRKVPVDSSALGHKALKTMPDVRQVLVLRPPAMPHSAFDRAIYLARKYMEACALTESLEGFFIPSFSPETVVYKGLMVAPQLDKFYPDLRDPDFETAHAVFHQRYSTNTFPTWQLAQPFRLLGHNGEINTLQGNRNWIRAREPELTSELWGDRVRELIPLIQEGGSDSAQLDNVAEALMLSGRDVLHTFAMLVPEAWESMPALDPRWRAFYEYHASLTEPWDGPAALAFATGAIAGAIVDRNGLRPARYKITDNGIVSMGSEVGILDFPEEHIVEKGRLAPGQMLAVDTKARRLLKNADIKDRLAAQHPYGEWVRRRRFFLPDYLKKVDGKFPKGVEPSLVLQRAFGYTSEETRLLLKPMVEEGKEPVGSMGDDTPLGILAQKPRLLYSYFKQKFAQVTNPPIDYLREQVVMALDTYLGARGSLLEETPEHAKLVFLASPILSEREMEVLRHLPDPAYRAATLSCLFPPEGPEAMETALQLLCEHATQAVNDGAVLLILSDKGVDKNHAALPMLLAVGAVHHHLTREGQRMRCSIIAETGEAREMHHLACLIGYGASAVHPYLALAVVRELGRLAGIDELTPEKAVGNYVHTLEKQVLKIMSKMGISAVSAYHGGQIFEAIGVSQRVIDFAFAGTISNIEGVGFKEIAEEALARHQLAFGSPSDRLEDYGYYRFRRDGELHGYNPLTVAPLHKAVAAANGGLEHYKEYRRRVEEQGPIALRDLLTIRPFGPAVPLGEVEPASEIVKRFQTGSMSLGALSPEAHEVLAIATNRIGARANTGEGGEQPRRWRERLENGDSPNSAAKQVASGRFGVTPEYLAMAQELEIKMAQGSKPGEGGQLPGHKVVSYIAATRRTQEGVPLISPPPHHDIYSIEDLAQLIYDLKVANPRARVSVKLVAEAGVGTIAAGVAKGYADKVHISGHEGGTGASPLSSIKNAGSPWELGLAETQQVLVMNGLRGRILVSTDGMMRTGRDVIVAALLGAEEYGFGTSALIAIGCQMARQCHLNTCPVGIATHDPKLRAKFKGEPEHLIRFFFLVAEEIREYLSFLGVRNLEEIIGRTELLQQEEVAAPQKAHGLDLTRLVTQADPAGLEPRHSTQPRNDRPEPVFDDALLPQVEPALRGERSVRLAMPIRNVHRTVGGRIAGEIAYRYGDAGLPDGIHIELTFHGSAGQSFGAWCINGMHLVLNGEANDYVGKGMHGGEITMRPQASARFASHENVLLGNTALYGATGGYLFASGRAGERFAVRNSGAWAVVEGAGDHCCEYMTGGVVVVLGPVGRNVGAGMSGGTAFFYDPEGRLPGDLNGEMVQLTRLLDDHDVELVHSLISRHVVETGSKHAAEILEQWDTMLPHFWKVFAKPTIAPPPPRELQLQRRNAMLDAMRAKQREHP
ncbi:MAG: glutamate synthase large subunit [Dehalococcoidia bacterium]|nr:glutamate synthase large subunit [Dehalococcoidia bacterium]